MTVACGTTCAYLGDGRDLREFLVANDAVQTLRDAGHVVRFLLFDDNVNLLNVRQLRVGMEKNAEKVAEFEPHCGKPIYGVPSPDPQDKNYSRHFQRRFLERLARFGCHPELIATSDLYDDGLYVPYVRFVVENQVEIRRFLLSEFPGSRIGKLFTPVCPSCGFMDEAALLKADSTSAEIVCGRCDQIHTADMSALRGKLSWKIDCAVRWALFKVSVEPFTKQYLEPKAGSYRVARAIAHQFFGQANVVPVLLGMTSVDADVAGHLMTHIPAAALKGLFTDHWSRDINLTKQRLMLAASRTPVYRQLSFLEVVKRLVPEWALSPLDLDQTRMELLAMGVRFARDFMNENLALGTPDMNVLERTDTQTLIGVDRLLLQCLRFRSEDLDYDGFCKGVLGSYRGTEATFNRCAKVLRTLMGQSRGIPACRFLYALPEDVVRLVQWSTRAILSNRQVLTHFDSTASRVSVR